MSRGRSEKVALWNSSAFQDQPALVPDLKARPLCAITVTGEVRAMSVGAAVRLRLPRCCESSTGVRRHEKRGIGMPKTTDPRDEMSF